MEKPKMEKRFKNHLRIESTKCAKIKVLEELVKELQNVKMPNKKIDLTTQIISLITSVSVEEDKSIIYACVAHLLKIINHKHIFQLSNSERNHLLNWFQKIFNSSIPLDVTLITATIAILEAYDYHDSRIIWRNIVSNNILLNRLNVSNNMNINGCLNELLLAVVRFYDAILYGILITDEDANYEDLEVNKEIAQILTDIYYKSNPICFDDTYAGLFTLHVLRILTKLCTLSSSIAQTFAAEIFGLSRYFFFYGLNESVQSVDLLQKVLPSQQAVAFDTKEEAMASYAAKGVEAKNSGGRLIKTRKLKIVQRDTRTPNLGQESETETKELLKHEFSHIKTSDSDFSDKVPSDNKHLLCTTRKRFCSKVRLTAIGLLEVVALAQARRNLYGYWHAFFPTFLSNEADETQRYDLFSIAEHDPNERCRCLALQVSSKLIYRSKAFLAQAELISPRTSNSFQTFVHHLGTMLLAVYNSLTSILAKEASDTVLTQALKTLAVLVQATSFMSLKTGNIVRNFLEYVRPLVYNCESTIKIAALMVMEFLLVVPELSPEIYEHVGSCNPALHCFWDCCVEEINYNGKDLISESSKNNSSWLLLGILDNISQIVLEKGQFIVPFESVVTHKLNPLLIQSLKVLNAMANHFTLLLPKIDRIAELFTVLITPLSCTETLYHASHCFSSCVHHMKLWLAAMQQQKSDNEALTAKCFNFWACLLPVIMTYLEAVCANSETNNAQVYENLMDAISNMGPIIYEKFPHTSQIQLLSLLSYIGNYMSSCEESGIYEGLLHSSAVRALAVFATFPTLRTDLVFIENTAELALRIINDQNVLVRNKVFWSIGNVTDALVMEYSSNYNNNDFSTLSDNLLHRLIKTAIRGCGENHKIRSNAVRILGNLLRLLSIEKLQTHVCLSLFLEATNTLKNACLNISNTAKTRWNSCYSIGTLLRNQALFDSSIIQWQSNIYDTLCKVIVEDKNFKVRINAANAIQQIAVRQHYLTFYDKFWSSLLIALERSCNLENFYEYNHRDKLQEQLCVAISHLVSLAEPDDYVMMGKKLFERLESVQNTWVRVTHRLVPEKAAPLMACSSIILQKDSTNLTPSQKKALKIFGHIFNSTI